MSEEIQESKKMDVSQTIQTRNQRKFPIPKTVNYYILNNYAMRYYNATPEERLKMLKEISENIRAYGFTILPNELERRFKNMKAHYRRKREDFDAGIVKSVEWEYYQILDGIFSQTTKPKRSYNRIQPVITQQMIEQAQTHNFIPKVIIHPNAQVKLPENMMPKVYVSKRKLNNDASLNIKKEKLPPTIIDAKTNETPLDMSLKKTKVIQFNNINDITQQLPLASVTRTIDSRNTAVQRISEELHKLDTERINLDEQRLQLEIKRNEIDKAAYILTQLLHQVVATS